MSRSRSNSMADDPGGFDLSGATSTTKALMISIVCPRKVLHKAEDTDEEIPSEIPSVVETAAVVDPVLEETITLQDEGLTTIDPSPSAEDTPKVGNNRKSVDKNPSVSETVSTAGSDAEPLANELSVTNNELSTITEATAEAITEATTEAISATTVDLQQDIDATPVAAEEEEDEHQVTPEEAAAVTPNESPHGDDENASIVAVNMEELLRITFANLLKEWHLLNVPTFSLVDQQKAPKNIMNNNLDDNNMDSRSIGTDDGGGIQPKKEDERGWIYLQVMARPSSLGIILERLERIGVGVNAGTVSIFKVELCKTASPYAHMKEQEEQEKQQQAESEEPAADDNKKDSNTTNPLADADGTQTANSRTLDESGTSSAAAADKEKQERIATERRIEAARAEWKNAATRLRIEQVREQIADTAALSFDFISLLIVASILSGIGLISNNTVVIVASMLVSPIMGPVLGLTFGTRIGDWPLVKLSLLNETLALVGCVLTGALIGISAGFTQLARDDWPTNEMAIRGETTGLLTGIAIAIPSGMGVCLSILGGNTSSLVGVAISASLLPPAVNAGICFVYAILIHTEAVESDSGMDAKDFAEIGAISFALTALNILCIWLSGLVMFEIKEVAPTEEKSAFWARDIKVARDLNRKDGKAPPPVSMPTIMDGIRDALRSRNKDDENAKPIDQVVKIVPPRRKHASNFGNRTLGETLALGPPTRQRQRSMPDFPTDRTGWVELPHPNHATDEAVRYVGLEDISNLLGFDKDDDDEYAISWIRQR